MHVVKRLLMLYAFVKTQCHFVTDGLTDRLTNPTSISRFSVPTCDKNSESKASEIDTRNNVEASWRGCDSGFRRSKIKVMGLNGLRWLRSTEHPSSCSAVKSYEDDCCLRRTRNCVFGCV